MKNSTDNGLFAAILSYIHPYRCLICDDKSDNHQEICEPCKQSLLRLKDRCYQCGLPTPPQQLICGSCISNPPPFDHLYAPFLYQPPLNHLLTQLKFNQKLHHAKLLAELFLERLPTHYNPEIIIPVPLHPARQRERGYNQAMEIARPISKQLGIPLVTNTAYRVKKTELQSRLKAKERHSNIRQAFKIEMNNIPKQIVIFDDVVTTTSTVRELAQAFKKAGVERIDVWAIARTIPS